MATQLPAVPAIAPAAALPQVADRRRDETQAIILARVAAKDAPLPAALTDRPPTPLAGDRLPTGVVQATVLRSLDGNQALVDIDGQAYQVRTRQALVPGETLLLRLLQANAEGKPVQASSAAALAATLAGAADSIESETDSTQVRLSAAARLVESLARDAPQAGARPLQLTAIQAMSAERHTAVDLAQALRTGVERSGLFYESHLREWVQGQRSSELMQLEPQAKQAAALSSLERSDPAAQSLRLLVQDQLATLETGRVSVSAQWLGLPFRLELQTGEREARTSEQSTEGPSAYARLRVETPHLGTVVARMNVTGQSLRLQLEVGPEARSALDAAISDLQNAMREQEIVLGATGWAAPPETGDSRGD